MRARSPSGRRASLARVGDADQAPAAHPHGLHGAEIAGLDELVAELSQPGDDRRIEGGLEEQARSGIAWSWMRGVATARSRPIPKSTMFTIVSSVDVMMRGPPEAPMARRGARLPQHQCGAHARQRSLAGVDRVRVATDEAVDVRHAGRGGEVVHLVVEDDARAGHQAPSIRRRCSRSR